jgi:cytochrome c oxidase subunit 6b
MPHADHRKHRIQREEFGPNVPHFTDFSDPRFAHTDCGQGGGGNKQKIGHLHYFQWIHCIGNWGEEHSMCKKQRWYVEKFMMPDWLERYEEKRKLGHYDYTLKYGAAPWKGFEPHYKPVKKVRKGAYEFWQDRDFEQLIEMEEGGNWKEHAPILHDIYVLGKKPVYDDE